MACRMLVSSCRLLGSAGTRSIATQALGARCTAIKDEITHTGQFYDEKDYRNARFVDATKVVNENWAIKLIDETPIIQTDKRVVYCDGGTEPALGHPKVYINLDKPGAHACGYCGLRFQKIDHHH
ncbi:NADH dehydrogenase [ubiquinone] iron-sulfur protein 6, mitochondrial [Toxorhynchites rutilus septentrionalis]|uniref:NADH dehydrogenase [ubiquinone] iron-sulfur protein 6, mitochondrial n=1 Tax=Toxorhynchites rutilus septentrionalis TaxID=329112 RepID=UPI00247841CA|nr:NADH dehydrogenase [ubiquinone] iron-sulfur protein 6, mitochondrial [Toxorhynchites rutilus septentrionalis]